LAHPKKSSTSIILIFGGRDIERREEQFANARLPIAVHVEGMRTSLRPWHPWNDPVSMQIREVEDRSITTKEGHEAKEELRRWRRLGGSETFERWKH